MSEQRFEYRIQKILESKGYLVINCARSKPFDLVAMKEGKCFLIEVKGKNTSYPKEQAEMQRKLSKQAGFPWVLIKQSKERGKFRIEPYQSLAEWIVSVFENAGFVSR